jgi:hypothetical protein
MTAYGRSTLNDAAARIHTHAGQTVDPDQEYLRQFCLLRRWMGVKPEVY